MRIPSTPAAKVATSLAAPVAIVTAAALIWSASNAAFSATTRNSGNNWSTGTVALTDDDGGSARFQITNLIPGQTGTKCIVVTANASVPGVVRNYYLNPISTSALLTEHIMISGSYGTGGSFGSCAGYTQTSPTPNAAPVALSSLVAVNSYAMAGAANPTGDWTVPAGTTSRTFEITWAFDTTGLSQAQLDTMQGSQTGIDVQWELQNS
jgi:hypothetical protein